MNRRVFHLPFETYKRWVRACPESTTWVQPQGIGEPLMYPHIVDALSFAKKRGLNTMLYTNATLLTANMSEQILEAGIDELTFSIDGFNERSFETRVGASWKKVVRNVDYFHRIRNKRGYKTYTKVRATITPNNRFRIMDFVNFWIKRTDDVAMMPLVMFPTPEQLDKTPYAMSNKGFQCYHIFDVNPRAKTPALAVLNNGNVVLCCQDWFSDYVMGNLHSQSPIEAFNSPKYAAIRHGMTTGTKYPFLCEFCRLGKIGKKHRFNLFRIASRGCIHVLKRIYQVI